MNEYAAGSTSVVDLIYLMDSTSTTGGGKTGLVFNTAGLTCYYKRSNGTASVAVTLASITTLGTFVSGGFKEIDATGMPGAYEFQPPDAAFVSGAKEVTFFFTGAAGLVPRPIKYRILAVNPDDAVRMGQTALPNVAQGNAGALPTGDASGKVNVGKINDVATTPVTTIGANVGTTQPLNFTGTGASAYVLSDKRAILGTALTETVAGQLAGGVKKFFDVTSPTITLLTVSNLTQAQVTGGAYALNTDSSGRVVLQLGSFGTSTWAAGAINNSAFANNAIASNVIAPSAITSIAAGVWNALTSGLTTVGSIGKKLTDWVLGTDNKVMVSTDASSVPNVTVGGYATGQDPATLVLDVAASGHNTTGTVGAKINTAASAGSGVVTGYATGQDPATLLLGATAASWNTSGTIGNKINSAASAGDPWATSLPGSYGAGSAGAIIGAFTFDSAGNIYANARAGVPVVQGSTTASTTAALANSPLLGTINYPLSQAFSLLGLDSTGWTQFVFTIKATPTATDAAALVTVKLTNPSSGSDGLTLLNGAAPSGSTTAADGSLAVNSITSNTSLTLTLTARAMAIAAGSYMWELTRYSGGAGTKAQVGYGQFGAEQSIRVNPVAS